MSLTAAENSKDFELIPEDQYTAICYGIVDLGMQYNETYEKNENKICFLWELTDSTYEKDGKTMRRTARKIYTNSLHKKSALRSDLEAWRGKAFTDEEKKGFMLSVLVGTPCLLQISHDEYNGKKFTKISSIMRLPAGMPKPTMQNTGLVYDFDNPDEKVYKLLPEWLKTKIGEASDFKTSPESQLKVVENESFPF